MILILIMVFAVSLVDSIHIITCDLPVWCYIEHCLDQAYILNYY